MKIVDANILLYAINRDSAHHASLKAWWQEALAGDDPIGLPWIVLLAFLRISTHPRAFAVPLRADAALRVAHAWLSSPAVRLIGEGDWKLYRDLLEACGTAGNLTTDAYLASLAMAQGAVLVSCDSDFSRFPKLRWINPLDSVAGGS